MKKIIIMLGLAATVHFSASAQINTTGAPTTTPGANTIPGGSSGTNVNPANTNGNFNNTNNSTIPGGYQAPNGSYRSHYPQGTQNPTNSGSMNNNSNSTISPNATMPGNTPSATTPAPNLNTGTNPVK